MYTKGSVLRRAKCGVAMTFPFSDKQSVAMRAGRRAKPSFCVHEQLDKQ